MRIGILGAGSVGASLATGLADAGHDVMLGTREPERPELAGWASKDAAHRRVGDYAEATDFGDLVVFAVPGRALGETLDATGRERFPGKLVIDATNPIATSDAGEIVDAYGETDSGAEFLQRELGPTAPVVKAFNQINASVMLDPSRSSQKVLRIAGDDEGAKTTVRELLESFGWEVRDLGPLSRSRALEHGVVDWVRKARG